MSWSGVHDICFFFGGLMIKSAKISIFVLYCLVSIYIASNMENCNWLLMVGLFFPICMWLIVLLHELSHWLCFKVFGFEIKELRISLFLLKYENATKSIRFVDTGFFSGYCTIKIDVKNYNIKLIISLAAGGISGFLTSIISFIVIILNIVPDKCISFFASLFCGGLYGFCITLLSSKSADKKLIEKIMKEK